MRINRITIKGASGYCHIDEAYEDKITLTPTSISYEYKPHPESKLDSSSYRRWSYKTNSLMFENLYNRVAEMTPYFINNTDVLMFATDVGPVEIIATFEDKHRESANYFCPSEFFADYFKIIKQMIPSTEYIPATLLTQEDFDDDEIIF